MLKNKKGITLISLVVTIIILLILAGVTIYLISGSNGIMTKASNSRLTMEQASVLEKLRLAVYEKAIDYEEYGEKKTIEYLIEKGIVEEEKSKIAFLGKVATLDKSIRLGNTTQEVAEETGTRYIVIVDKILKNMSTGKGDFEKGDVYYIRRGDLYYQPIDSAIVTNIGNVFDEENVESEVVADASWFNYIEQDGKIRILGIDFSKFSKFEIVDNNIGLYWDWGLKAIQMNIDTLIIPEKINGKEVVYVSFDQCKGLSDYIGKRQVLINGLKTISYPITVKEISGGTTLFQELEEIILQEGLEKISGKAFVCSSNVKSITIPSTIKEISGQPFWRWNDDAIVNINASEENLVLGHNWNFKGDNKKLQVNFSK